MSGLKSKLNKPRRRGESLEDYLGRVLQTDEERILYWELLTTKMYSKTPKSVVKAIEVLKDKNPEACTIMENTLKKLKGESN